ncbi:single-stranded DNA-binding protein [Treponema sp.]|uniref:single-stranded DNA-binding protein n=1 Tax=Treponema sp. TaxID=166 RepID=UPI00388D2F6D
MTDINTVTIVGRLTRDLNGSDQREYAFTPNGQARANISIAVNRSRKQGDQWIDEANFFNVTIWGKTAENLLPYLKKGKQICVEGYLKQDRWQDKTTGQTRSNVSIVANNVQLLGGNSGNGGSQPSGGYTPNFQRQSQGNTFAPSPVSESSYDDQSFGAPQDGGFPEDIPF